MARLSWPGWLVTYRDGLPACWRSPIQVLTGPGVDWLRWCDRRRYQLSHLYTVTHIFSLCFTVVRWLCLTQSRIPLLVVVWRSFLRRRLRQRSVDLCRLWRQRAINVRRSPLHHVDEVVVTDHIWRRWSKSQNYKLQWIELGLTYPVLPAAAWRKSVDGERYFFPFFKFMTFCVQRLNNSWQKTKWHIEY